MQLRASFERALKLLHGSDLVLLKDYGAPVRSAESLKLRFEDLDIRLKDGIA